MNAKTLLVNRAEIIKNTLIYVALSMIMLLTPMHPSIAKTIDNLNVGDKDSKVFINTDQLMTKDGAVIKNLDVVQQAFNTSSETDNIKVCRQSNTAICKLRLRERMPAVMNFNEDVKSFVLGDGLNFAFSSVDGSRNIYKLEGYYPGADTNLTIIGESGLIYSFYIRIDSVASQFVSDFVINVNGNIQPQGKPMVISSKQALQALISQNQIIDNSNNSDKSNNTYLDNTSVNNASFNNAYVKVDKAQHRQSQQRVRTTQQALKEAKQSLDYLDTKPSVDVTDLDFNFEVVHGDKQLMPKSVFDDGIWTYWQYGHNNLDAIDRLPVPYAVVDGYDTAINSRIEGGYLITEGVSNKWTLRSGESYACVRKFE